MIRPNPIAAALGTEAPKRLPKQSPVAPGWLDAHQAAAYLGVGLRTIHKLRKSPDFPKPRTFGDRATRWKLAALEAWADAQPCVCDRPEPAPLTARRAAKRASSGGGSGGTPTPASGEPCQSVESTSGADFELAGAA